MHIFNWIFFKLVHLHIMNINEELKKIVIFKEIALISLWSRLNLTGFVKNGVVSILRYTPEYSISKFIVHTIYI